MRLIRLYLSTLLLVVSAFGSLPFPVVSDLEIVDGSLVDADGSKYSGVALLNYECGTIRSFDVYSQGSFYGPSITFLESGELSFLNTRFGENMPKFEFSFERGVPSFFTWENSRGTTEVTHRYNLFSNLVDKEQVRKERGQLVSRSFYADGRPWIFYAEEAQELKLKLIWYPNGLLCLRHVVEDEPEYVNIAEYWWPDGKKIAELVFNEKWELRSEAYWDRSGKSLERPPFKALQIDAISTYKHWLENGEYWP